MNKVLCLCLFIVFSSFIYGQNTTKEDAINYIKSRVNYRSQTDDDYIYHISIRYDYKTDTLYYTEHLYFDPRSKKINDTYWVTRIPMKDININRIILVKLLFDEGLGIVLYTNYGVETIRTATYFYESDKLHSDSSRDNFIVLKIPNYTIKNEGIKVMYSLETALKDLLTKIGAGTEKY